VGDVNATPMDSSAPSLSELPYDELIITLRKRAAQRRANGEIPETFVEDIDDHFQRILRNLRPNDAVDAELESALQQLADLRAQRADIAARPTDVSPKSKRADFRSRVLRAADGLIPQTDRRTKTRAEQYQQYQLEQASYVAALEATLVALLDRLRTQERQNSRVTELERRLDGVWHHIGPQYFKPPYTSDDFERHFRAQADFRETYGAIAEMFVGFDPVLDIGCGNGDFLGYLADLEVAAHGVEINIEQAALARERGHNVITTNGLTYLHGFEAATLGGIVALQVIEHLTIQERVEFFVDAFDKLRPGGKLVLDTPNPSSLYVFAHAMYTDPTHTQPIHSEYLAFLARSAGFNDVVITVRTPVPEHDRPAALTAQTRSSLPPDLLDHVEKTQRLLFGPQDYLLVATR
jgi:SAM-dependent methyltransferase